MLQLDPQSLSNMLEVIRAANAHFDEVDSLRKAVLKALQKTIPTDSSNFFLFDQKRKPINPVALNLDEKYLQLYQSHFFRDNPFDPINLGVPSKAAIPDKSLYCLPDFTKTGFFNDFLRPQEIRRQMVIFLKSNKRLLGFIGLHRSKEKEGFEEREVRIAETIAPYLALYLEKAQLFERTKSKGDFFQVICDCVSVGVAILDFKLKPIFINEKGQEICARMNRRGPPFTKEAEKHLSLPSGIYKDCMELKHQLKNARQDLGPSYTGRSISLSGREEYSIRCEVLNENLTRIREPLFLVTMGKMDKGKDIPEDQRINEAKLKGEFNFTKREIEIVNYIFKGLKNSEIAELLYICEGTVKNHLKNIFEKMGVENRTSLIYEVLSL